MGRIREWLGSSSATWFFPVLALALSLPALGFGLQTDDHALAQRLRHGLPPTSLFSSPPAELQLLRSVGMLAWWSSPRVAVQFVRPLSSLWHALDYSLWPEHAWFMHLENGIVYALVVLVASLLYRRLQLESAVVGLASLLFAIDDGHGAGIGWISSRNTLLSSLFGLLALLAHIRSRADRRPALHAVSALCVGLALLSAEAGTFALAYLAAYAYVYEPGSLWKRACTLAPQLGVSLVWAAGYLASHAGLRGSSWYRELDAPLALLVNGVLDLPIWLVSLFGTGPVAVFIVIPDTTPRLWCLGLACLFILPLLYATPRSRQMRFCALGALLCLPPLFTTVPQDRVLMGASFGACGIIAGFVHATADTPLRVLRWARAGFLGLNLIVAPLLLLATLGANRPIDNGSRALAAEIAAHRPEQVVLVNAPIELLSLYATTILGDSFAPPRHTLHTLYAGHSVVHIERLDPNTLELQTPRGYGRAPIERVFCRLEDLPRVGEERALVGMHVSVKESNPEGLPTRVQFRFPSPLESPDRLWLVWQHQKPVPWKPPAVGERVTLEPLAVMRSLKN